MKAPNTHPILALFALASLVVSFSPLRAHEGVEIGPNGGRILEFSKDETMHGELTLKDGVFHVALLDHEMKPVAVGKQTINATGGTRQKPDRLKVEKGESGFTFPEIEGGQWLILQFKESPLSRSVTARMHYDTRVCDECDAQEWLCACEHDTE